ncbi:MAG: DUF4328 domain-containing protein [Acidimicrobiia bacterium]|nr:DUF4328 domain-containing protein [Acidimicrobiia bacterium]
MKPVYRQIRSLAGFLQLAYSFFVVMSTLALATGWTYRGALLDVVDGNAALDNAIRAEDAYLAVAGIMAIVNLVLIVTFVVWFWRAYGNLRALGRETRRKPGWAIGGWLIPIGNFFIPYGIGAEIWKKCAAADPESPSTTDVNIEPVISWWALFLIMGLVDQVAFFSGRGVADDPERLAAVVGIDLVSAAVGIAAAIAAARFVRLASERQDALRVRSGFAGLGQD